MVLNLQRPVMASEKLPVVVVSIQMMIDMGRRMDADSK